MNVKANGNTFEFRIFSIARGRWVVELVKANGETINGEAFDCEPTEREARAAARFFAAHAKLDRLYGWAVEPVKVVKEFRPAQ